MTMAQNCHPLAATAALGAGAGVLRDWGAWALGCSGTRVLPLAEVQGSAHRETRDPQL